MGREGKERLGKKGQGQGGNKQQTGTGQVEFDSLLFSLDHSIIFEYENGNMQQKMATALQTLQMDM